MTYLFLSSRRLLTLRLAADRAVPRQWSLSPALNGVTNSRKVTDRAVAYPAGVREVQNLARPSN